MMTFMLALHWPLTSALKLVHVLQIEIRSAQNPSYSKSLLHEPNVKHCRDKIQKA